MPVWDRLSAEEKSLIVRLKMRRKDGKDVRPRPHEYVFSWARSFGWRTGT